MKSGLMRSNLLYLCVLCVIWGCASSRDSDGDKEKAPFIIQREPEPPKGMQLAPIDENVRSIQLYRANPGGNQRFEVNAAVETQFPIIVQRSSEVLNLEFDLMEPNGRPFSVYFYHADRDWQRDLSPAEYLGTFQRDDIISYTPSRATDVPYTHYTYQFPNESLTFLLSGNYIVRVSEQGREEEVLFERPFFISEQSTSVQMGIENVIIGQGGFSAIQPAALFLPPSSVDNNVFDFSVCFSRNGRFEAARCSDQPSLTQPPALRFFLLPSQAFEPVTADYVLDISALRVGNRITRVDFNESPFLVTLEPDYARFPGDLLDPVLNGQTVISGVVRDVANPDVSAQYVRVRFGYIPDTASQTSGKVYLVGSFNGWHIDPEYELEWSSEK